MSDTLSSIPMISPHPAISELRAGSLDQGIGGKLQSGTQALRVVKETESVHILGRVGEEGQGLKSVDSDENTYKDPRLSAKEKQLSLKETKQQQIIDQQVRVLAMRDREVRAHEQAHMAAGGQYAGSASYEFERGPNGISYAVGGEVSISTGPAATPQETLRKAQVIRGAALAPAEPSTQDRRVAAMATQLEAQARSEITKVKKEEATAEAEEEPKEKEVSTKLSSGSGDAPTDNEKTPTGLQDRSVSDSRTLFSIGKHPPGLLLSEHA